MVCGPLLTGPEAPYSRHQECFGGVSRFAAGVSGFDLVSQKKGSGLVVYRSDSVKCHLSRRHLSVWILNSILFSMVGAPTNNKLHSH